MTWKDGSALRMARAEELINNLKNHAVMTPGVWLYNGSEIYEGQVSRAGGWIGGGAGAGLRGADE